MAQVPDRAYREAVLEAELSRVLGTLRLRQTVHRVILFGSLARGDVTFRSDIDLLIVEETKERFLDRLDGIIAAVQPRVAMDVLVYTPEEFSTMSESSAWVRRAVREGRLVYAKEPEMAPA